MIGIPLIYGRGHATVGFGKTLDGGDGLGRRGHLLAALLVRNFPAKVAHAVERMDCLVGQPAGPVMPQPLVPPRDVAQLGGIPIREGKCDRILGAAGGLLPCRKLDDVICHAAPLRLSSRPATLLTIR
jgi:hypothetical protein